MEVDDYGRWRWKKKIKMASTQIVDREGAAGLAQEKAGAMEVKLGRVFGEGASR